MMLSVVCDVCLLIIIFVVFFFKQKTAYEMRISDWSSDVCSSDLEPIMSPSPVTCACSPRNSYANGRAGCSTFIHRSSPNIRASTRMSANWRQGTMLQAAPSMSRSEEHTSELQSLMRISYAVFCLKKKTNTNNIKILKNNINYQ